MRNAECISPLIISFVAASSESGKTTLIEKIIPLLKAKGLRVAVIKHSSKGFDLDTPGKDSWRFQQAGADAVVLAGPDKTALFRRTEGTPPLDDLQALAGEADVVLVEGFKREAVNKIEVFRSGVSAPRPLCLDDSSFLALVSDAAFEVAIPRFDLNDVAGLTEWIIRRIFPQSKFITHP